MVKLWDTHTLSAIKEEMTDSHNRNQHYKVAEGSEGCMLQNSTLMRPRKGTCWGDRKQIWPLLRWKGDRKEQEGQIQHRKKCGGAGNGL